MKKAEMLDRIRQLSGQQACNIVQASIDRRKQLGIFIPYPEFLPAGVREIERSETGRWYRCTRSGKGFNSKQLTVAATYALESDGRLWYHVSAAVVGMKELPDYDDMKWVKRIFIGDDRWAAQYAPPKEQWVNVSETLHWWHCLEENPFPDFRKLEGVI